MTLTATPVGPATRYSSFDLYKKGILNSGTSRAARVQSLQPRVQSTSRVQSNVQRKVNRRSAKRFSPRTILISILVVITFLVVTLPASTAFGGFSLVPAERHSADLKGETITIVVEPGDTLWSVARRIDPKSDPRIIVNQLADARGTSNLYAGEIIEWAK